VHDNGDRTSEPPGSSPLTAAAGCGVGVWSIDAAGVFRADSALLTIWGRSLDELARAQPKAPACFVYADDRALAEAVLGRVPENGEGTERMFRIVRPDGSLRWVLCRRQPFRLEDAREHVAGIAVDVTAMRQVEDARSRTRTFDVVATLAARLAHDFNNLLFAILGNATLALGTAPTVGDHPVRESLREIERAGTRASEIVQRLSSFARPAQPRRQMLKLGALVDAAARGHRDALPPELELSTHVAANEPSILVDPRLIQELVSNLVSNAVHALEGRGGAIELEVEPVMLDAQPWVTELGMKRGRYLELRVRDDGTGMDAATLERCAEPFFSTRPKGSGMGLGLGIAHGVVKGHGGVLRIESVPERGTTVRAYFPQP
jgi:PAS domain S-box-containing protein